MANVRMKSGRGLSSIDSLVESLRDYTMQTEDLSRLVERQRGRMVVAGYLLFSFLLLFATIAIFIWSRVEGRDVALLSLIGSFTVLTFVGLPLIASEALQRYFQYRRELFHSGARLANMIKIVGQIRDHVEADRLEEIVVELRLSEADAAFEYSQKVLNRGAKPLSDITSR